MHTDTPTRLRPISRPRRWGLSLVTGLAAVTLAITACTAQDTNSSADELDGEENTEEPEDLETESPDQDVEPQEPREDLINERVAEWEDYQEVSETELEVRFMAGNPSCYGVRAEVVETEDEVRIATVSGTKPEAEDQACTQELLTTAVVVTLEEELGDREVTELSEEEVDLNS